jgi:predicted small lipoprotein YifL
MPSRTKFPLLKMLALAVVSLTAVACGLKGPLYQPDAPKAEVPNGETTQKKKDPGSVAPPDPDRPAVPPDR